ncbi:hypothetical protein PZA11_002527 [Diplocarpon coronariae]|uniref:F-box domain containing protein n=1 Tax=Diplocarpon coronariae TaxID=2795749 RepID=A0A218ZBZ5_9HELO|nr:F-box domain-containing protein [Diplocarpon mali]OWP05033.1 f-box domain containing protein [Marssonina coronariae]
MDYEYEIRRRTRRKHRHRPDGPAEHEHKHSSYSPFSFRGRYRDPPYPTHYPDARSRANINITTVPDDVKLSIFDRLDPADSACLGLSSRHLYPSHRRLHRGVGLYEQGRGATPLVFRLADWAPASLMLDPRSGKYVARERHEKHGGRQKDYWDGRLRRVGKRAHLRRGEERLRRVGKVFDLRESYYRRRR